MHIPSRYIAQGDFNPRIFRIALKNMEADRNRTSLPIQVSGSSTTNVATSTLSVFMFMKFLFPY